MADVGTFTEYGCRYNWSGGTHITAYDSRQEALKAGRQRTAPGQTIELVKRTITVTAWEPASGEQP